VTESSDVLLSQADVQATFCATLVDEWIAAGVDHAVVAPGSRSTPMALAIASRPELAVHVVHDERVAAFVALGLGVATDRPALLLCTSGTAAVNFHPAVVEAGLSDVPMIVLTADRPPELIGVGAPQAIDQTGLYGTSVRWFHDPGVPDLPIGKRWRRLATTAMVHARTGPVHLNLPFREPLVGAAAPLPARDHSSAGWAWTGSRPTAVPVLAGKGRGVILAGGRSGSALTAPPSPVSARPEQVAALAEATGWPVLADPPSGCRHLDGAVTAFDSILRHAGFAEAHRPDVVIRVGRPAASKVLTQWVVTSGAPVVQVGGPGTIDPDGNVAVRVETIEEVIAAVDSIADPAWRDDWLTVSRTAEAAIADALDRPLDAGAELTEPGVARIVARHRPAGGTVVVSASMPMRDYEWFGGPTAAGYSNRGANGIDGVVSTAIGVALSGRPVVVLVGDVAFVHDAGALTALRRRGVDVRIVVVDNDGGGIFSFLPQATALAGERFEQLFGTPHGTDVVILAAAHGLDAVTVATADELRARLERPGPHVTRVATDRVANVAAHAALHAAVTSAIDASGRDS
jgi:2-succinyl-5-enolpyruvyl-6-hydroxy-3-cyclohexene-1-carboxylate synthase